MKTLTQIKVGKKSVFAVFGQDKTQACIQNNSLYINLKIPTFSEENQECLLINKPGYLYEKLGFYLVETEDHLIGALVQPASFPLKDLTYEVYLNFLEITQGWNLFRVWNYVPYINQDTDNLENYKSFCLGRSLAFETFYGQEFEVKLPAASAVGINDDQLVLYFIAGKKNGNHIENYEQISAFKYPQQYGPRSPSFARGTLILHDHEKIGYISGTASIKGHQSVTLETVAQQLHTTLDNMSIVCEQMGLVERMSYSGILPDPSQYNRHFKVYIRHQSDVPLIQEEFPKLISATTNDQIIYLQSDICRSNLDLEIEAIIEGGNTTNMSFKNYDSHVLDLPQMLLQTSQKFSYKTAIIYDQLRLTYQDLYQQVTGFSQGLKTLGVKSSDCVMILLPNCPEFVISFYAIAQLQAIALPLNPVFKANEIQYYAQDSNISVIITDRARSEGCRQVIAQLNRKIELIITDAMMPSSSYFYHLIQPEISGQTSFFKSISPTEDSAEAAPNQPLIPYLGNVLYQYSSGSTGRPKKLSRTQKNIFHQVIACTTTLEITATDNILAIVPLYHAYGFGECLLAAITTGATLVILEPSLQNGKAVEMPLLFRRERILQIIEQEKITLLPMVPYIASVLATTPLDHAFDLSSLRLCLSAGNFLSKEVFEQFLQRFKVPLRQLYGCTEAGAVCVNTEPMEELQYNSIGKPMSTIEIKILDENKEECSADQIGEIVIKSPTLTCGYTNLPELNQEVFSGGYFFTGDLGKKDAKGCIYITGRKKNFIDTGGYKVDPLEVEDVLISHPLVKEGVVVGTKGFNGVEFLKAVVVTESDCSAQDIITYCQERLADFKVPQFVEFRSELPKDPIFGKIKRKDI
jgi:long-chain acyl-CoA synthetase